MQTHSKPSRIFDAGFLFSGVDGARVHRLAACLAAMFATQGGAASASVLPVSSCDDDGSPGTLRSVVGSAHNNDTVDLQSLACSTISLADEIGSVYVGVDNLVIRANVANPVNIGAGFHQRVLLHAGTGHISLVGLNISGGMYLEPGGCVRSAGSVYLSGSSVSNCHGTDKGGGIYAAFDLELVHARITGNVVDAHDTSRGGGVYVGRDFTMRDGSTISGNLAASYATVHGRGGGAYVGGNVSVIRSTISGNTADSAGGLAAAGAGQTFYLGNSTVSGNTAAAAGGIRFGPSKLLIYNSTIAFNQTTAAHPSSICLNAAVCAYVPPLGPAPALHSTIIASNTNAATGANADLYSFQQPTGAKNLIVSANVAPPGTLSGDPQLGPLSDNGGPTQTHALAGASPAIDAGDPDGWAIDQRGSPRVFGAAADIGSYERQNDIIFANGFQ